MFPTEFCHPKLNASVVLTHTCNEASKKHKRKEESREREGEKKHFKLARGDDMKKRGEKKEKRKK